MTTSDLFLLLIRWLHLVSAAAWVGGSLFYLLVLLPAVSRSAEPSGILTSTATEFRALVNTCIVVLMATGLILAFNRLTDSVVDEPYVATLALKSGLSVWMILLVHAERRRTRGRIAAAATAVEESSSPMRRIYRAASGFNALVILGIAVLLLSDVLKVLYEIALSPN